MRSISSKIIFFLLFLLPRNIQVKWTCGVLSGSTQRKLESLCKAAELTNQNSASLPTRIPKRVRIVMSVS